MTFRPGMLVGRLWRSFDIAAPSRRRLISTRSPPVGGLVHWPNAILRLLADRNVFQGTDRIKRAVRGVLHQFLATMLDLT